jgi:hypothetical protein
MRAIFLLLGVLGFSFTVEAAAPFDSKPAIPIYISISHEVDPRLGEQIPDILNSALKVVQSFPPRGYENNLFNWSVPRQILFGKNVSISVTLSHDPALEPLLSNAGANNMDMLTIAPMNSHEMSIIVVILADKVFFNAQRNEYPDAFSRLIVGLAHEIYGNVQHFLYFNLATATAQTMADRVAQQQNAFRASISFLHDLYNNQAFAMLPLSLQKGLIGRLPFEIHGYRSWLSAHPSAQKDPSCEKMLAAIKNLAESK